MNALANYPSNCTSAKEIYEDGAVANLRIIAVGMPRAHVRVPLLAMELLLFNVLHHAISLTTETDERPFTEFYR